MLRILISEKRHARGFMFVIRNLITDTNDVIIIVNRVDNEIFNEKNEEYSVERKFQMYYDYIRRFFFTILPLPLPLLSGTLFFVYTILF